MPIKTIAEMYEQYLSLNSIDKSKMSPNETIERKRTFYGAAGMFLTEVLDVGGMDEDTGAKEIEKWWQESIMFWREQSMPLN